LESNKRFKGGFMASRVKLTILFLFLILACSERKRMNQFDVGSEGFATPPPCYTWGAPVYDPYSGRLVAVRIVIEFTDELQKTLSFTHRFFFNNDMVLEIGYSVDKGSKNYGLEINYGGQPFPLGDYCLKIYWGECGYGAFVFSVVQEGDRLKFKALTNPEACSYPDRWLYLTPGD